MTEVNSNWSTTFSYELNHILLCFSFVRIYIFYRFGLSISKFMNPRSKRVCQMNGCEANQMFAIKALMKEMPFELLLFTIFVTIVLFGYCLKIFEGPLSEASGQDYTSLSNGMWNVVITMTTTGYGDIYPKSTLGRCVGAFLCFWGTFIMSFFVVTINNLLTFSPSEDNAYTLLLRLYYKELLKIRAINVLNSAFKQRLTHLKRPDDSQANFSAMRDFRSRVLSFKQTAD